MASFSHNFTFNRKEVVILLLFRHLSRGLNFSILRSVSLPTAYYDCVHVFEANIHPIKQNGNILDASKEASTE
jgi:hypothetical protein